MSKKGTPSRNRAVGNSFLKGDSPRVSLRERREEDLDRAPEFCKMVAVSAMHKYLNWSQRGNPPIRRDEGAVFFVKKHMISCEVCRNYINHQEAYGYPMLDE